ncbi:hypothetical protein CFP56_019901 [Quercus suber]|uniref:Secreted protein n=1 Tax=Quercus suber TaxID=58331 RepID=A0AAW0KIR7_QUESU
MTTGPVSLLLVGLGLLNPYTKALLNSSTFTSPSNSDYLFYISTQIRPPFPVPISNQPIRVSTISRCNSNPTIPISYQ